ncbi:hypothetical protein D3C85_1748120 [compost metagenome]
MVWSQPMQLACSSAGTPSKGRPAAMVSSLAGRPPPPKVETGKRREPLRGCFMSLEPG